MSFVNRPRRRSNCSGFTLLELIVVIAIIATLASFVAPSVFRNASDAKITAARSQLSVLALALDTYRMDMGTYPSEAEGLSALTRAPAASIGWRGPYLRQDVPADPWGRAYVYTIVSSAANEEFSVTSLGRDGRSGGSGEDADLSTADSTTVRR